MKILYFSSFPCFHGFRLLKKANHCSIRMQCEPRDSNGIDSSNFKRKEFPQQEAKKDFEEILKVFESKKHLVSDDTIRAYSNKSLCFLFLLFVYNRYCVFSFLKDKIEERDRQTFHLLLAETLQFFDQLEENLGDFEALNSHLDNWLPFLEEENEE